MSSDKEQTFTTQPHPAKDNHPTDSDLQGDPSENSGGLRSSNPNAMGMAGPQILSGKQMEGMEQPKSREELKAEAEKLNS